MASRLRPVCLALLCLLVFAPQVRSDPDAFIVTRPSNLREGPASSTPKKRHLDVGEILEADRDSVVNDYRFVSTDAGEEGWVWTHNIDPATEEEDAGVATTPTSATAADAVVAAWEKPEPNHSTFKCADGTNCGPTGSAGDAVTNLRKDRTDTPESHTTPVHPVSFGAILALPDPHCPRSRVNWSAAQLQAIAPFEGAAISLEGFLVAFKPQTHSQTGESCNCHKRTATDVDVHMALVQNAGEGEGKAIVVETSPRVRKKHAGWTREALSPLVDSSTPVRVSGWLMYDPEHRSMIGSYRESMWEIHPITKIEVFQNNGWHALN